MALLLVFLVGPTAVAQQQSTWWIVIVTGVAIDGRNVSMFIGPYPSFVMCNSQLGEARGSIGPEVSVRSIGCKSNVEVARIVLSP